MLDLETLQNTINELTKRVSDLEQVHHDIAIVFGVLAIVLIPLLFWFIISSVYDEKKKKGNKHNE